MPDASTLALFVAASLAMLVVPGPAVLYIVAQSIAHGRRAGLVSMLGIQAGGLVHVAAATVGLSSLLVSSSAAFTVVKIAGALYLIMLGVQRLLSRDEHTRPATPASRLFSRGVIVNVLNPKTALFFFAFLPQFVDPDGPVALQMLGLGLIFIALAMVSDGAWALLAGTAGGRLRRSRVFLAVQRYVSGGVLIGLGVATAFSGSRASKPSP